MRPLVAEQAVRLGGGMCNSATDIFLPELMGAAILILDYESGAHSNRAGLSALSAKVQVTGLA